MLYEEGSLTVEQAEQIIGEKMRKRIEFLNDWVKKNGYRIMLHSTFKGIEKDIFLKGLNYPIKSSFDSRDDILEDSNIPERDLISLEKWVENNNGHAGRLSKSYETYPPSECDTVTGYSQINAKDLLEYNHRGGNITIILCVPTKKVENIGRKPNDSFRVGFTRHIDPYLRRSISCKQNRDGKFKYKSEYFYPTQGILCAFDRENIRIKFNNEYDETFYLDSSTPQKGKVQRDDLVKNLKNIEKLINKDNSQGISR